MKLVTLLSIVLAGVLTWMYFYKESGHNHELKSLIESHKSAMDSSRNEAEGWRLKALEYGNQFRKEATRAQKAETRFNYLREENEKLKRRPVIKYSDIALDSMFRARYGTATR